MAYSPAWRLHWLQERQLPGLRAVARRHAPVLEEFTADLGAGREVVFLVIPAPRVLVDCPTCWAQRRIWEPAEDGSLIPLLCPGCEGRGRV